MKIGLVTLYDYNFGSSLQAYASKCFIEERYCDCTLIGREYIENPLSFYFKKCVGLFFKLVSHPFSWRQIIKLFLSERGSSLRLTNASIKKIKQFNLSHNSVQKMTWKKLRDVAKEDEFTAFLSGSDQVWNGARINGYDMYFLRFAPQEKRIAWAPSFGGSNVASYNLKRYKRYISEFNVLSAREASGAKIIKSLTGREAAVLTDPVMLLDAQQWRALCAKQNNYAKTETKYILTFFIDEPSDEAIKFLHTLSDQTKAKTVSFGYYHSQFQSMDNWSHIDGSPLDFISIIDGAEAVITDSFHAAVFSALFYRSFYVFPRQYQHNQNQSVRIIDFLSAIHMEERFDPQNILNDADLDYSYADHYFSEGRKKAEAYLEKVIEQKKPKTRMTADVPQLYKRYADCCGCGGCAAVCSQGAITLKTADDGACYPVIDGEKCIHCGACLKYCAFKREYQENEKNKHAFIGAGTNPILTGKSSSGGIFASIADNILQQGGIVYGAAVFYNGKNLNIRHESAETAEQLYRLQGSKYAQSDTSEIFPEVKKQILSGRQVLFSGTSCQVAALYAYLGRNYDNLLTMDLICHGVPVKELFDEYVLFLERTRKKGHITQLSFREKGGNTPYIITTEFTDTSGKKETERFGLRSSSYYRMFMACAGYRASCYSCPYANCNKPADLTCGDYYLSPEKLAEYDPSGALNAYPYLSCIIANSEKGRERLSSFGNIHLLEVSMDAAINDHEQLQHPSLPTRQGEMLFTCYKERGFEGLERLIHSLNTLTAVPRFIRNIISRKH